MSECRVTHGNNGRSSLFSLPSFVNYFQIISAHSTEIWGCQVAVEEVDREKSDNEWNSSSFRRWREGISRWEFLRLFSASLHVKLTLIIQETKAASAAEEVYRKEWNFCRCCFFHTHHSLRLYTLYVDARVVFCIFMIFCGPFDSFCASPFFIRNVRKCWKSWSSSSKFSWRHF